MMKGHIGKNLRGIDETFDYIFEELLPLDVLKKIVYDVVRVHPEPSRDSTKSELIKSLVNYTKDRYSKEDHRRRMIDFLKHVDENEIKSSLKEPSRKESELNVPAKNALREEGYTICPKEVKIGYSRADVVGYRKRYETKIISEQRKIGPFHIGRKEKRTREYWHEFCGIELKTAKRDIDSLFKQITEYIEYFDYSFTAITPFSFLSDFEYLQDRVYPKCESEGMGILLIDKNKIIGTILEARESHILENNREYLVETAGLD